MKIGLMTFLADTGESEVYCHKDLIEFDVTKEQIDYEGDLQPIVDRWTSRRAEARVNGTGAGLHLYSLQPTAYQLPPITVSARNPCARRDRGRAARPST